MKKLFLLLGFLLFALPAWGQIPGGSGIAINQTPVTGGTTTQCLYITSASKVGSQACSSGSGTVTTVSVVTANGYSGSVANPTTTPAITLTGPSALPPNGSAGGDLGGTYPNPTLANGTALTSTMTSGVNTLVVAYAQPLLSGIYAAFTGSTGTVSNSSGITSITRNSAGNYTVVLSSAQATTRYKVIVIDEFDSIIVYGATQTSSKTTTQFVYQTILANGVANDPDTYTIFVVAMP